MPEEAEFWEVASYPVTELLSTPRMTCACYQSEPLEKASLG